MKTINYNYLILFFATSLLAKPWFNEKKTYQLTNDPIDILIPCHEKDKDTLQICVDHAKRFVQNVRRVIVVSNKRLTDKAEWFDEAQYPFSKESLAREFAKKDPDFYHKPLKVRRIGWYFQQLVNFYGPLIIPNISPNVLILNADTMCVQPIKFLDEDGCMLHAPGEEYHIPYFDHMKRFLPGLKRVYPQFSGISHHMIFQRLVLEDLFNLVETYHKRKFWEVYCECVNPQLMQGSGAADFEIYFNFILQRSNQIKIRPLKRCDIDALSKLADYQRRGFHLVSCHAYMRKDR